MASKMKHIIFTTEYDTDDYQSDYEYFLNENNLTEEDLSIGEFIQNEIDDWFQCEGGNLAVDCGKIIAIANLGLWNGRRSGYKINSKGKLNAILDMVGGNECEVYVEGNEVNAIVHHHDGTNYITFREVREDRDIQKLCELIYNQNEVSGRMLGAYTKPLGEKVKKIFGW